MADEKQQTDAAPVEEKKKSNILLYVGLFAAQLVVAALLVWFVLLPYLDASRPSSPQEEQAQEEMAEEEDESGELGPSITIESLTVNPRNSGGRRMLNMQVVMEIVDEEKVDQVKNHEPIIRSTLLRFFRSKTVQELSVPTALDSLPVSVKKLINETLPGKKSVKNVFFTRFIIT